MIAPVQERVLLVPIALLDRAGLTVKPSAMYVLLFLAKCSSAETNTVVLDYSKFARYTRLSRTTLYRCLDELRKAEMIRPTGWRTLQGREFEILCSGLRKALAAVPQSKGLKIA